MNLHSADIVSRLNRYLDRRSVPNRLKDKPQAMEDEIADLASCVERVAPRGADALAAWWPEFERNLSEMGGSFWPTAKEIRDAGTGAAKATPVAQTSAALDPAEMTARAMSEGRPVGDNWLYGVCAVELGVRRLVSRDVIDRYRSGAFLSRRALYGEEVALRWEAEAKARHEAAKAAHLARE